MEYLRTCYTNKHIWQHVTIYCPNETFSQTKISDNMLRKQKYLAIRYHILICVTQTTYMATGDMFVCSMLPGIKMFVCDVQTKISGCVLPHSCVFVLHISGNMLSDIFVWEQHICSERETIPV